MSLDIMTQFTAKNWTAAANVPAAWGIGPRTITSITIHWWGNPVGQEFAGIVDWFCNPQSSVTTSAHFVASAGQVACIVSPEDAAWHAGSAEGNVHSIGIECNPRCSDGDYQSIGALVAWLRSQYGNLPLYAHNHWTSTSCPGDYRLARIDAIANGTSPQSDTITPIQEGIFMALTDQQQKDLYDRVMGGIPAGPARPAIPGVPRATDNGDIWDIRQDIAAVKTAIGNIPAQTLNQPFTVNGVATNLAGILTAINAKPGGTGSTTDPKALIAAVAAQLTK